MMLNLTKRFEKFQYCALLILLKSNQSRLLKCVQRNIIDEDQSQQTIGRPFICLLVNKEGQSIIDHLWCYFEILNFLVMAHSNKEFCEALFVDEAFQPEHNLQKIIPRCLEILHVFQKQIEVRVYSVLDQFSSITVAHRH